MDQEEPSVSTAKTKIICTRNSEPPRAASEDSCPSPRPRTAEDPIFHLFPEPEESVQHVAERSDSERFIQKRYPLLHMAMVADEHPAIEEIDYGDSSCAVCDLSTDIVDAIKALKPHEIKPYLESHNIRVTEEQVNNHLVHSITGEHFIGVLQNMSVDLIGRSYSLANQASMRVMSRVKTHKGKTFLVADQDMAKVHNDNVKQFIALATTCQSLLKQKAPVEGEGLLIGTE